MHTIDENMNKLVGIDKIELENELQIKVYPNPTTGLLHLDKKDNETIQIKIIDQLGRQLKQLKTAEQLSTLDLSGLPTGIYFISIDNGKKRVVQKIVKQ
jgi:hypothetical protein